MKLSKEEINGQLKVIEDYLIFTQERLATLLRNSDSTNMSGQAFVTLRNVNTELVNLAQEIDVGRAWNIHYTPSNEQETKCQQ